MVLLSLSGVVSVAVAIGLLGVAWLVLGPILIGLAAAFVTSRRAD